MFMKLECQKYSTRERERERERCYVKEIHSNVGLIMSRECHVVAMS